MKNWHGHSIVFGTVVLSSTVSPPTLNNLYNALTHSPAFCGAFGVIESADAILDASTGLAI